MVIKLILSYSEDKILIIIFETYIISIYHVFNYYIKWICVELILGPKLCFSPFKCVLGEQNYWGTFGSAKYKRNAIFTQKRDTFQSFRRVRHQKVCNFSLLVICPFCMSPNSSQYIHKYDKTQLWYTCIICFIVSFSKSLPYPVSNIYNLDKDKEKHWHISLSSSMEVEVCLIHGD